MYSPKPVTVAEMLISLGILLAGWALAEYWERKRIRDREKKKLKAVRDLDEIEKKISS